MIQVHHRDPAPVCPLHLVSANRTTEQRERNTAGMSHEQQKRHTTRAIPYRQPGLGTQHTSSHEKASRDDTEPEDGGPGAASGPSQLELRQQLPCKQWKSPSHAAGAWRSEVRCRCGRALLRGSSGRTEGHTSLRPHVAGRDRPSSPASSDRGTNPIREGCTLPI